MSKKKLIVIMGKTCSGKDTLLNSLLKDEKLKDVLRPAVTYTTRPRRSCETDGVEHHFVTKEYYEKLKSTDCIVATHIIDSNIYFTTKDVLSKANIIILDINSYDNICQSDEYEVLGFYVNPSDVTRYERGMNRAKFEHEQLAFLKRMVMEFIHEPSIDDFDYDNWGRDFYVVDPSYGHYHREVIFKLVYEFMASEISNSEKIKHIVDVIHEIGLTNSDILDAYDAITDEDIYSTVPNEIAQEVGLLELCDVLYRNSGSELLHNYTKDQIDAMLKWYKLLITKSNEIPLIEGEEIIKLIDDYLK